MKHLALAGALIALVLVPPFFASGQTITVADLQVLIQGLKDEITSLRGTVTEMKTKLDTAQTEIRALRTTAPVPAAPTAQTGGGTLLTPPSSVSNVRDVQQFLSQYSDVYPEGLVTGYYGSLTRKAIQRFFDRYDSGSNEYGKLYSLMYGTQSPVAAVSPSALVSLPPATATVAMPVSPAMQQATCPALPSVVSCSAGQRREVLFSSPACGIYYTCVAESAVITTSTAIAGTVGTSTAWISVTWGRGGSSLVPPSIPQSVIEERKETIRVSCPSATYYTYLNPSDVSRSDAGLPSCPVSAGTEVSGTVGCARYGSGWHSMDGSGNCFDPVMTDYRDTTGTLYTCASKPVSGCSGNTAFSGDANSCPGFAYSRWDSTGKRYCQLNTERKCDYGYPSYLTNGANYKAESCPTSDSGQYSYAYTFVPVLTEPVGGCGQYGGDRQMRWTLHSTAIGGSCTTGSRPTDVVSGCPAGQWPRWDEGGWPVACSGGVGSSTATVTSTTSNTSVNTNTGGSAASCSTGQYWNGSACVSSSSSGSASAPAGQKSQAWNSRGLQSWIRTDADSVRIETLKTACANVASGSNIWMPGAGTASSVDFGMPDPAKCAAAAQCPSGDYYDGSSCRSGSSYYGGSSGSGSSYPGDASSCPGFAYSRWDSTGARYCQLNSERKCNYFYPAYLTQSSYTAEGCPTSDSSSSGGYTSYSGSYSSGSSATSSYSGGSGSCGEQLVSLLGSGCHTMGSAYFNTEMTRYVMPGTTTVKECSTERVSGCSGGSSSANHLNSLLASMTQALLNLQGLLGR